MSSSGDNIGTPSEPLLSQSSVNGGPDTAKSTKDAIYDSEKLNPLRALCRIILQLILNVSVKAQIGNTTNEFSNLANSRTTPSEKTATGQQLTHYHSMFYNLLSWENPRATAIAFTSTVLFIFAARYLNILRYLFKVLSFSFGVTALAELAGNAAFGNGLTSQLRPRRYYTLPKDSVDRALNDVHELINFFVIEFQRVLFAESPVKTAGAFGATLVSYFLIKFVPLWGLTLIASSVTYLAPLIYIKNKEVIDAQIQNASSVVNQQATQLRDVAGQHTSRATNTVKSYAGDYGTKAQEYIGGARNRIPSGSGNTTSGVQSSDFPKAPQSNPTPISDQFSKSSNPTPLAAS
ncbi:MAG: hypothetical protein M1825_001586 [Sarcosagium campestre]|nr:MAG: hypothetical protein M1825_001586 [Sarcosagium campestre]